MDGLNDKTQAPIESASRVNLIESLMVVKVLKYLLQQGYGMHEIVILTPYLGQLRLLTTHMREQGIADMADRCDQDELERQGQELEVRMFTHRSACVREENMFITI